MPPFNSRPFSAVGAQVAITCVGYLLAIPIGTAILADRFIQCASWTIGVFAYYGVDISCSALPVGAQMYNL